MQLLTGHANSDISTTLHVKAPGDELQPWFVHIFNPSDVQRFKNAFQQRVHIWQAVMVWWEERKLRRFTAAYT